MLEKLGRVRDKILDRAGVAAGERLLDVGCGEGLIGFGALERGAAHVVFSDISDDLLGFCREIADALGVSDRCSFVKASADGLAGISDASVDVVSTRSVLTYVADKERAFAEFFRVLPPGGRVSLFEQVFGEIQPATDPMLDFDERDLIRWAEDGGFFPIDLEYHAEIRAHDPKPWEAFLNSSGNPKIPTLAQAMDEALTPQERQRLSEHLRPLVESGRGVWRMGHAYLTAVKPSRD